MKVFRLIRLDDESLVSVSTTEDKAINDMLKLPDEKVGGYTIEHCLADAIENRMTLVDARFYPMDEVVSMREVRYERPF